MKTTIIETIISQFDKLNIDAMLITNRANTRYVSGFTGSNSMLYLSKNKKVIITDFRYIEQASKQCEEFEVVNQGKSGLIAATMEVVKEDGVKRIGFESAHTQYQTYLGLEKYDFSFVPLLNVVEECREIKHEEELKCLRRAEEIGDIAFSKIIPFITEKYKEGITENDVTLEIERIMRKEGASGLSFDTIVASGAKSSLCHATPGPEMLKKGDFVVMDFGCKYEGYCSDMTRTIVIGEASEKHREIYDIVLKAQLAALEAIKPGKTGKEIDAVARNIIKDAGYGDYFGHGLGHSVGLDIHESPRFSPSEDKVLESGMVLTVEPGIYIPGFGGVRIEDVIVVTEDGYENLTKSTKELVIVL
ncbi:MAG: M24 family metallopeptidase [Cellulosilyticaceae bacterium]